MQDLTNLCYGRFTVLGFSHRKSNSYYWFCRCACGVERVVIASNLKRGHTTSCGCRARELFLARSTTHGWASDGTNLHSLYIAWQNMKHRCSHRRSNKKFKQYTKRGITIDPAWLDFNQFKADMLPTWKEGLTLDRIDNDGPYAKWNCRWATKQEQSNNTSVNRWVEFNGKRQTVAQWAIETGIKYQTLRARLNAGWPLDRALTR